MHEWAIQADLDAGQVLALNIAFRSVIAQMQRKGTLPEELVYYMAQPVEYEIEFIPEDLEGMETEGNA